MVAPDVTPANRPLLVAYLRWLADQPDGVRHREWLFQAAAVIDRAESITWIDKRGLHDSNAQEENTQIEA